MEELIKERRYCSEKKKGGRGNSSDVEEYNGSRVRGQGIEKDGSEERDHHPVTPSLGWGINTHTTQHDVQELTVLYRLFDPPEEPPNGLCIPRSPKFLKRVDGTQRLGLRLFRPALSIQKVGT